MTFLCLAPTCVGPRARWLRTHDAFEQTAPQIMLPLLKRCQLMVCALLLLSGYGAYFFLYGYGAFFVFAVSLWCVVCCCCQDMVRVFFSCPLLKFCQVMVRNSDFAVRIWCAYSFPVCCWSYVGLWCIILILLSGNGARILFLSVAEVLSAFGA